MGLATIMQPGEEEDYCKPSPSQGRWRREIFTNLQALSDSDRVHLTVYSAPSYLTVSS